MLVFTYVIYKIISHKIVQCDMCYFDMLFFLNNSNIYSNSNIYNNSNIYLDYFVDTYVEGIF